MIAFFEELLTYNNWANQHLLKVLVTSDLPLTEKIIRLQNHNINAHQIWNSRIIEDTPFGVNDINNIETLAWLDQENYRKSLVIVRTVHLDANFTYTNSHGHTFTNTMRDMMFHVVNHTNYHRAQIITECKSIGLHPLPTDYIFYAREKP